MSKQFKSFFAIICVVVILAGIIGGSALADLDFSDVEEGNLPIVIEYSEIPLYVNGEFIGTGFKLNGITYVPMLAFCEAMLLTDFYAEWDQDSGSVYLSADGIEISLTLSDNYIVANGRCFYLADGAYNINGTIMVPIRELAKIFNLDILWDDDEYSVHIDTSEVKILESAEEFYDEESLYWLSHVIFAESGAEPLEGMIGVGNVVLNRVYDETDAWKDTIKGVIFQVGQFAVAETGGVYLDPSPKAIDAAKMCLEGYNTVGDSKFFFNPELSSSSWFEKYKTFVCEINDHVFYA